MATINFLQARYLSVALGKNKGYLVIPANNKGLVYFTDSPTAELQINPEQFIEDNKLAPVFCLVWIDELSDVIVCGVKKDGTPDRKATTDPKWIEKTLSMVNKAIPALHQNKIYFSQDQVMMLAVKAMMKVDEVSIEVAKGNVTRLLDSLEREERRNIISTFNMKANKALSSEKPFAATLPQTVEVQATVVETPSKATKATKAAKAAK